MGYPCIVHGVVEMSVREKVSSDVPAAPSDPYSAASRFEAWQSGDTTTVIEGEPAVVADVGVVVAEGWGVTEGWDVAVLGERLEQAARARLATPAANTAPYVCRLVRVN